MSEQVSRKHGPVEDDAIKRQDRRELEAEGEERPDADWLDENDAPLDWAAQGRFAGHPPGEDWEGIELRSELARHVNRAIFPTTASALAQVLAQQQAPQALLGRFASLAADASFGSMHDVLDALDIAIERRPGT